MSQAKVDKYKQEKKNRAKIMKRQRIKKYTAVVVCAMLVGAALGIPLGKKMYSRSVEQAKANKTISSTELDTWFQQYWVENYSDLYAGATLADDEDTATDTDAEASVTDAEIAE
jgi:hypothetical protein